MLHYILYDTCDLLCSMQNFITYYMICVIYYALYKILYGMHHSFLRKYLNYEVTRCAILKA